MARVTLQTIADKVGVSRMTVSNAFSRPDQLSAPLRARILATAEELGYAGPDAAARALVRGRSGVVGILLTDAPYEAFTNEVTTGFLGAITRELGAAGLSVALLSPTDPDAPVNPLRDLAMDGAIVYSCTTSSPAIETLAHRALPTVYVDHVPIEGTGRVGIDDEGGARSAVRHLLDLGHTRIAVLSTDLGVAGRVDPDHATSRNHVTSSRLTGWLAALHDADADTQVWGLDSARDADVAAVCEQLLGASDRPTGVVCVSDQVADGLLRTAERLGVAVPDHLSVVGFDDAPVATRSRPPLTTVRQDLDAKGRAAAQSLVNAIAAAPVAGAPRSDDVRLPTRLVVRASTGPTPA